MSDEKSPANLAMAAQIRAEQSAKGFTQMQLAEASGINYETLKRILKGTRDINVTQIAGLASAFGISAQELVRLATERLERMPAAPVSEVAGDNVTKLHPRTMTAEQHDRFKGERAADAFDENADQPEE